MFQTTFPILSTPDLGRAQAFYCDLMDGRVSYRFPAEGAPAFVTIEIGGSTIGLGADPDTARSGHDDRFALWVYVDDCDAAVARLRAAGTVIVAEPADQPWGERIARVRDPDGTLIVVGAR